MGLGVTAWQQSTVVRRPQSRGYTEWNDKCLCNLSGKMYNKTCPQSTSPGLTNVHYSKITTLDW